MFIEMGKRRKLLVVESNKSDVYQSVSDARETKKTAVSLADVVLGVVGAPSSNKRARRKKKQAVLCDQASKEQSDEAAPAVFKEEPEPNIDIEDAIVKIDGALEEEQQVTPGFVIVQFTILIFDISVQ